MTPALHNPSPSSRELLPIDLLSRRVREARAAVQLQRHHPASAPPLVHARHVLLAALEDYVTALEARGLPVPQGLQQELHLHRELFD